jgi:hypothetical protein
VITFSASGCSFTNVSAAAAMRGGLINIGNSSGGFTLINISSVIKLKLI